VALTATTGPDNLQLHALTRKYCHCGWYRLFYLPSSEGTTQLPSRDHQMRRLVAGTVTLLWAVSMIVDMVNPMYDPPSGIHSLMLVVAGGIFGAEAIKAGRKDTE